MECSDDDEQGSASDGCPVLLGFLSDAQPATARLSRQNFPSKVGGSPAWLEPQHLPAAEQLVCSHSGKQLKFLLQVYAPVDHEPTAFHRAVFVFVSPQGDMLDRPGAVRAFRSQLPRANTFYSYDPPQEDAGPASFDDDAPCVPGWSADEPFPERELVIDEEPCDEDGENEPVALKDAASVGGSKAEAKPGEEEQEEEGGEDDLADFEDSEEQAHFAAFTARVAREPAQCLRYSFDSAAAPLWPSRQPAPEPGSVPPCSRCGAPRHFEFQVMPQLLNYLNLQADDPLALDFGTIAIYSCSKSCALEPDAQRCVYAEEYVFVQPHSAAAGVC